VILNEGAHHLLDEYCNNTAHNYGWVYSEMFSFSQSKDINDVVD